LEDADEEVEEGESDLLDLFRCEPLFLAELLFDYACDVFLQLFPVVCGQFGQIVLQPHRGPPVTSQSHRCLVLRGDLIVVQVYDIRAIIDVVLRFVQVLRFNTDKEGKRRVHIVNQSRWEVRDVDELILERES
jgi:hypothetical protein